MQLKVYGKVIKILLPPRHRSIISRAYTEGTKGYSLIEITIVMAIIGTFAGVYFGMLGQDRLKLNTVATMIAQDIRLAQQLNMNQDGLYTIRFDCLNEKYFITRYTKVYKKVELPGNVDLLGTNFDFDNNPSNGYDNKLCFNTRGEPIRQNSGYLYGGHVTLKDKNGNCLYVIVASKTGRVRISAAPP